MGNAESNLHRRYNNIVLYVSIFYAKLIPLIPGTAESPGFHMKKFTDLKKCEQFWIVQINLDS